MAVDQDELEVETVEEDELVETLEGDDTKPEAEAEEELQVQIGEDAPPQDEVKEAPNWVKELRQSHREAQKRIRELEALQSTGKPVAEAAKVLQKPTLAEHDYDEEKFDKAMDAYYAARNEETRQAAEKDAQRRREQEAVDQVRQRYTESAKALKVKDYGEAEDEVVNTLSVAQQGLILGGADKPELLVYALGKNPEKLRALASIKDPVKFAFAASKLEKDLKVTNRKPAEKPMPESTVKSSSSGVSTNAALDRLRAEAAKTGDMSKVMAFKRQMRKA